MAIILCFVKDGVVVARAQLYPRSEEEEPMLKEALSGGMQLILDQDEEDLWAGGEVCSTRYLLSLEDDDH